MVAVLRDLDAAAIRNIQNLLTLLKLTHKPVDRNRAHSNLNQYQRTRQEASTQSLHQLTAGQTLL